MSRECSAEISVEKYLNVIPNVWSVFMIYPRKINGSQVWHNSDNVGVSWIRVSSISMKKRAVPYRQDMNFPEQ